MRIQAHRSRIVFGIVILPCLSPLLLGLVAFVFPTPSPGPWPYGQPTLFVEKIVAIAMIAHVLLSLIAVFWSYWAVERVEWRTMFWGLVILSIPTVLIFGFELSMSKAGKWL